MTPEDRTKFPELAKMADARNTSQAIGEFLEWMDGEGLVVCEADEGRRGIRYIPLYIGVERLLARYFDIDLNKVEQERQQILDEFRSSQGEPA